jgi:sucrose phosphorylase
VLDRFQEAGITMIRLDAVGHAVKKAGTSCFMIPETFAFIASLTAEARARGMEVLVEVHGHHQDQIDVARQVDRVYDFALPPLVLHALYRRDAAPLKRWLAMRPHNAITVLDTHDGIGVRMWRPGGTRHPPRAAAAADVEALIETIHERSGGASRLASGSGAANVDASQINCTFYDALGRPRCRVPDRAGRSVLRARHPADLLRRPAGGRQRPRSAAPNRRRTGRQSALLHARRGSRPPRAPGRPIAPGAVAPRNAHPAFGGTFRVRESGADRLALEWANGSDGRPPRCRPDGDACDVTMTAPGTGQEPTRAWSSMVEA